MTVRPQILLAVGLVLVLTIGVMTWALTRANDEATETPGGFLLRGSLYAPECGGGYQVEGASVTVRDGEGSIIGASQTSLDSDKVPPECTVDFTVDLPRSRFYEIEIGSHEGPSYSFEQMQEMDWTVDLDLD